LCLVIGMVIGGVAFKLLVGGESSFSPEIEASLPASEKREILGAVRADTRHQIWLALKAGDFKKAMAWFKSSWKPKFVTIGRQGDGNVWIHVGIPDKTAKDGYSVWSRYIFVKEQGHWRISRSF
jgi:hypothetical protein